MYLDHRLHLEHLPADRSPDHRSSGLPLEPDFLAVGHLADISCGVDDNTVFYAGHDHPGGLRRRESGDRGLVQGQHTGFSTAVLLSDAPHHRQQLYRSSAAAIARCALSSLRDLGERVGFLLIANTVRRHFPFFVTHI